MNDTVIQLVRSAAHGFWAWLFGLEVVAQVLLDAGIQSETVAEFIAVPLTVAAAAYLGRQLAKLHPWLDAIFSVIPREPTYAEPPAT